MPRPVRRILAPLFRWRVVSVTKSPSTARGDYTLYRYYDASNMMNSYVLIMNQI
jgi:hypothetical protein